MDWHSLHESLGDYVHCCCGCNGHVADCLEASAADTTILPPAAAPSSGGRYRRPTVRMARPRRPFLLEGLALAGLTVGMVVVLLLLASVA